MKTITINLYKLEELSEAAQKKAIDGLSNINVDYEWWNMIFEDAELIGLKITSFELDCGSVCKGELQKSMTEVCELIIANHGELGKTYKTATGFLTEWNKLVAEHSDSIQTNKVAEGKEAEFDELADMQEEQFKNCLLKDYLIILKDEYGYLTSEAAIKETIISNEYDFTIDGKMYRELREPGQ